MRREVALQKLVKILGKSMGYRVDLKAPDQEARDEAFAKHKVAYAECEALDRQKKARMAELLQADAEFQRLKVLHAEANKLRGELYGMTHRYRFTVGNSNGMFFMVKAQGDSWEEVIAKLEKERVS